MKKLLLDIAALVLLISLTLSIAYAAEKTVWISGDDNANTPPSVNPKTVVCIRNVDSVNWDYSMSAKYDVYLRKGVVPDTARIRFVGADPWGGMNTIINLNLGGNPQPIVTAPPGLYQYVVEFLSGGQVIDTADPYLQVSEGGVGGVVVPVDKFGLLAPYIGLTSTILVATAAATVYVKRIKRRKVREI